MYYLHRFKCIKCIKLSLDPPPIPIPGSALIGAFCIIIRDIRLHLHRGSQVMRVITCEYWKAHTIQPVNISAALDAIREEDERFSTVAEIGPCADIIPLVKRCVIERAASVTLPSFRPPSAAAATSAAPAFALTNQLPRS